LFYFSSERARGRGKRDKERVEMGEEAGMENKRWEIDETGDRESLISSNLLALSYKL
jgi:hypothetical protein